MKKGAGFQKNVKKSFSIDEMWVKEWYMNMMFF